MLSVLIPVYNYDVRLLVNSLHEQLVASGLNFEIICQDDASQDKFSNKNKDIESLNFTSFRFSENNLGRIATRQRLVEQAKYDWLLFLDADVMPISSNFIENYLKIIGLDYSVIYGGFTYQIEKPKPHKILRWTYGKSQEQVDASLRNQTPYRIVISANMLVQKSLFLELNKGIKYRGYGYDNYFGSLLKSSKANVLHINNEVIHLGLESNDIYLAKIEESIETLHFLHRERKLIETDNSLLNLYLRLKRWRLDYFFAGLFKILKQPIKKNILSKHPNILLLQFYKFGYLCHIDLNP